MRFLYLFACAMLVWAVPHCCLADTDAGTAPAYGAAPPPDGGMPPPPPGMLPPPPMEGMGMPQPLFHVWGDISAADYGKLRDAHATTSTDFALSVVPAGGVNAGKYHVEAMLSGEQVKAMQEAHASLGLNLNLQMEPVGPPQMMAPWQERGHGKWDRGEKEDEDSERGESERGEGGRGCGCGGGRDAGWGGDGCSDWARDWHQQGCGSVHVHNLGDWAPDHHGYEYGWPYAGWDANSWSYIRNDGSSAWYTGQYAGTPPTPPLWYDAQWKAWARTHPTSFWLRTQSGPWYWGGGCGCGCGGGRWHWHR